ncbi:MAG TPA: VCBS repeat-containing protein, partial [Beijerinckiaceae bacterium]|nr:VCBS repeat-containing protein [Beijerinckiaceae bacterium]
MPVTLTTPINTATAPRPFEMAAGDLNGDGRTDLVTITLGNSSNGHNEQATVLLGDGQGGFQTSQTFGVGSGPITTGSGQFQTTYAGWHATGIALAD